MNDELALTVERCRGEIRFLLAAAVIFLVGYGLAAWYLCAGHMVLFAVSALCLIADGAFVLKVGRALVVALLACGAASQSDGAE